MMNVLVSACLLGENCKYNGGNNYVEGLPEDLLGEGISVVAVCPEREGGLPTPRVPAERVGDKVMNKNGEDVTEQFLAGANAALELAKKHRCKAAVLKSNSPSCGCGWIYDGTFTGTLVKGDGVTAQLLRRNGIVVYNEDSYEKMPVDFL